MKRIIATILMLALLLTVLAVPAAQAASYPTATVKGGWLRLRAGASYDAETISAYYTGTSVTILGGSGSWYYVSAPDGKTGYMDAAFLTITGSITGGQLDENTNAWVTSKNGLTVRLRTGPSTQYSTIASYSVGTPLTILISGDTWCKVRVNNRTGYMMTEFITRTQPEGSTGGVTAGASGWVTSKNGLSVRLRSGAGTLHSVIASYAVGTPLTILEYGESWCKVSIYGSTGYMMTEFITTTYPSGSASTTAYVTSDNGLSVRLRSGASRLHSTIATYSVGTKVTVLEWGSTWSRVKIGANTGYMMTEYLTTTAPTMVTAVTVSAASVWPGQTVTASVSPSGVSASVEWLDDRGVLLGSGAAYTVQTGDAGRRIRARATGNGGAAGTAHSAWVTVQSGGVSVGYQLQKITISDTTPAVGQTLTAALTPAAATANISWFRQDGVFVGSGSTYTVKTTDLGMKLYAWAEGTGLTSGEATSAYTAAVTGSAGATMVLQKVTISDTTPAVGQTLTANVTPAGAAATFIWRASDGRILGYDSTYTVKASDAGVSIYVYANGTGSTTGSVVSGLTEKVPAQSLRVASVTISDTTPTVGQTLTCTVSPDGATALCTWYRDDDKILAYGDTYTVKADDAGHVIYIWAEGTGSTSGSATSPMTAPVAGGSGATRTNIP